MPGLEQLWVEIGSRAADVKDPAQEESFNDAIDGLWPSDYEWILSNFIVRDAVSAFEVYLEKASEEALLAHRLSWRATDGRSPNWRPMVDFYLARLTVDLGAPRIEEIRRLRPILTNQRGKLRDNEST